MNDVTPPQTPVAASRRTVLTAAAWSAPVIAAAATTPFASASPCSTPNVRLNWLIGDPTSDSAAVPANNARAAFTRRFAFQNSGTTRPARANLVLSVAHSFDATATGARSAEVTNNAGTVVARNGSRTQTVQLTNVGGTGEPGYTIAQRVGADNGLAAVTSAARQTITFNFGEEVRDLTFQITDIDRTWAGGTKDFIDAVTVSAVNNANQPVAITRAANTNIVGSNTEADPWRRPASLNNNIPETDAGGNLALSIVGPVRSFTIVYRNYGYADTTGTTSTVDNNQTIFVTGMSLTRIGTC